MGLRGAPKSISPEDFQKYVNDYIEEYNELLIQHMYLDERETQVNPWAVPSIHDFCRKKMGISYKSLLYNYKKDELYTETINNLTEWIVDTYHKLSSVGLLKPTWLNFYMKNMHDWKEKTDTNISGKLNIMTIDKDDEDL